MAAKRVGFVAFPGIAALDLVGPFEAFAAVRLGPASGAARRGYELIVIAASRAPVVSESGVVFRPDTTFATAPSLDTLIVPGGSGLRAPATNARVSAWIRRRASRIRRIASVCTGIYGLASTGLLDGRRVTTHWRFASDVAQRFPRLEVDPNALFLKDGPFYTSAGVTAGIDLALAMIEEDYGSAIALSVARELVMYLKRPGGQQQYSEPLRFQAQAVGRVGDLLPWLLENLSANLSVEALAARAYVSPRQFTRQFKKTFGRTPAAFVGALRLDEARRRLAGPGQSIESVAASVGFNSADVFRRAFERRFRVSPSAYRGRFETTAARVLDPAAEN